MMICLTVDFVAVKTLHTALPAKIAGPASQHGVIADRFKPSKNMRRILRKNDDLIGNIQPNTATAEQYSLFQRYVDSRHGDGGMANMTVLDYAMMVEDSHVDTNLIEYRERGPDSAITGKGEGNLIAVVLFDQLGDSLSMVYSYFDPDEDSRQPWNLP